MQNSEEERLLESEIQQLATAGQVLTTIYSRDRAQLLQLIDELKKNHTEFESKKAELLHLQQKKKRTSKRGLRHTHTHNTQHTHTHTYAHTCTPTHYDVFGCDRASRKAPAQLRIRARPRPKPLPAEQMCPR